MVQSSSKDDIKKVNAPNYDEFSSSKRVQIHLYYDSSSTSDIFIMAPHLWRRFFW